MTISITKHGVFEMNDKKLKTLWWWETFKIPERKAGCYDNVFQEEKMDLRH